MAVPAKLILNMCEAACEKAGRKLVMRIFTRH